MTVEVPGARTRRAGLARAAVLAAACALSACATTGPDGQRTVNPKDPLEPFNRKMFAFNDTLDKYALKPAAQVYQKVLPSPIRTGVHNVFGNFSDAWSSVNQLLQGKFGDSAEMGMRVLTNTIIGIGGLFDPATDLGLDRRSEDLGQTFGRWGVRPGPYLVLPLFGPSDVRDAVALPADTYVSPALLTDTTWQAIGVDALGAVDARANLLSASQMLDDIALDRYTFLRDAYVSRRRSLVYDGNPPDEPRSDDDDDIGPTPSSAPAPAGVSSGAQGGMKPSAPPTAASGAKMSFAGPGSWRVAATPVPPSPPTLPVPPAPPVSPAPLPIAGVVPAPLPASAPALPVPVSGPAPIPPPPASAPFA